MDKDRRQRIRLISKYSQASMVQAKWGNLEAEPIHAEFSESELETLRYVEKVGKCIMSDISNLLRVAPTTATSLIDRLEKKNLVTRSRTDLNRRVVLISLTQKGKDVVRAADREQDARSEKVLSRLTAKEQDELIALYRKLASFSTV